MAATTINGTTQIRAGSVPLSALVSGYSIPTGNLAQGSLFLLSTGAVAMTASFNAGGFTLQNVATPVNTTDAATKAYVDQKSGGIGGIHEVNAYSSTNVSIASAPTTVDGITLTAGMLLLLGAQTTGSQNGPWVFSAAAAAMTRPTWWATGSTVNIGQYFLIAAGGTVFGDTKFWNSNTTNITVDTTVTTFVQDNGTTYTNGTGLSLTGGAFSVNYGTTSTTAAVGNDSRITGALQTTALGTGVQTALGVAVGTAGAFVVNGGALGTPTSGSLTNCSGLPVSGLSGLGTGVSAALSTAVGTAGAFVVNGGALGTPASGTLTNCTGLPLSSVTGLGTGVSAALAAATGAAGGVPVLAVGGFLAAAQFPALAGDVTNTAGSLTATVNNTAGSGFPKYTNFVFNETPSGLINGSNTTYTLAFTPATGSGAQSSLEVMLNGEILDIGAGNDFTLSGATITMLQTPQTGDKIRVYYMR